MVVVVDGSWWVVEENPTSGLHFRARRVRRWCGEVEVVGSEGKPHPRLAFASEEGGEVTQVRW